MKKIFRLKYVFIALAVISLALVLSCATSRRVEVEGDSEVVVTATKKFRFKVTGPASFPTSYPHIGGLTLPAGESLDLDLEPGESVTIKDKIRFDGTKVVVDVVEEDNATDQNNRFQAEKGAPAGPFIQVKGNVLPGSTYTWTVPSLFGDAPAVVHVTGSMNAVMPLSAVIVDDDGSYSVDSNQLMSFAYHVDGGSVFWQLPIDTPYGTITGNGTIESEGTMSYDFNGDLDGVDGSGGPDGSGYIYRGAFPVRLDVGSGVAFGVTSVWGHFYLQ